MSAFLNSNGVSLKSFEGRITDIRFNSQSGRSRSIIFHERGVAMRSSPTMGIGGNLVAVSAAVVMLCRRFISTIFPNGNRFKSCTLRREKSDIDRYDEIMNRLAADASIAEKLYPSSSSTSFAPAPASQKTVSNDLLVDDSIEFEGRTVLSYQQSRSKRMPNTTPPSAHYPQPPPVASTQSSRSRVPSGRLFKRKAASSYPSTLDDILADLLTDEHDQIRFAKEIISNLASHLNDYTTTQKFDNFILPSSTNNDSSIATDSVLEKSSEDSSTPSDIKVNSLNHSDFSANIGDSTVVGNSDNLRALRSLQQNANVSADIAASLIRDATNVMLTTLIDDAIEVLNLCEDSIDNNRIDTLRKFMSHAASLFGCLAPRVKLDKPVIYTGRIGKGKLERLFLRCLELEVDESFIEDLQRVLGIKEKKAEQLKEKCFQKQMMNMIKDLQNEDPDNIEAMMSDLMAGFDLPEV